MIKGEKYEKGEVSWFSPFYGKSMKSRKSVDFTLFHGSDSKRARAEARVECISPTGRVIPPVRRVFMVSDRKDQTALLALRAAPFSLCS